MYVVDDLLDAVIDGMHDENKDLPENERWETDGEPGGDAGHPLGPMVFQRVKNKADGRVFQITITEIA